HRNVDSVAPRVYEKAERGSKEPTERRESVMNHQDFPRRVTQLSRVIEDLIEHVAENKARGDCGKHQALKTLLVQSENSCAVGSNPVADHHPEGNEEPKRMERQLPNVDVFDGEVRQNCQQIRKDSIQHDSTRLMGFKNNIDGDL